MILTSRGHGVDCFSLDVSIGIQQVLLHILEQSVRAHSGSGDGVENVKSPLCVGHAVQRLQHQFLIGFLIRAFLEQPGSAGFLRAVVGRL